jgi:hypothetical protein
VFVSGHHGKVTGMTFSGGNDQDSPRYVATVSGEWFVQHSTARLPSHTFRDDKMLMVWDLETRPAGGSPSAGSSRAGNRSFLDRPQPTAYAIPFPHPLTSVSSHPLSSKEFLVSDNHGSIFLTDWRSDPEEDPRNLNVVELVEPRALSDAVSGIGPVGAAAWRADNPDVYVFANHYLGVLNRKHHSPEALCDFRRDDFRRDDHRPSLL